MARKKGGGGKLNRSQIIQARLDPKMHMAAEIMARSERRTLSSFIERTIEQAAKSYSVRRNLFHSWWSSDPKLLCSNKIYSHSDTVSVERAAQDIVDNHEAIRFIKFALYFPDLLNQDEEELLHNILFTQYFWMHYPVNVENQQGKIVRKEWMQVSILDGLVQENLFDYWNKLKKNKISYELLSELPIGKKIDAPFENDPLAIYKIVLTGEQANPYRNILLSDAKQRLELSHDDVFWKKRAKNLTTKKIEIKQTDQGLQIVTTHTLPSDIEEQQAWIDFCHIKMEENGHGN